MTGIALPAERDSWRVSMAFGVFTVVTLVFTWAFASFLELHKSSDLTVHITYAQQVHSLADLKSPHFLFQLLVKAGYELGLSYGTTAVWLLGACYGGMAVLLWQEMRLRGLQSNPLRSFALVMATLLASHIFLLTIQGNLYRGYFVPTAYHNPTQQLNKLFALWVYFLYARQFLRSDRASWSSVPLLAALCILSAVAKPSFLIAFLPAAALYAAYDVLKGRWRQALVCLLAIGIPSALTLLWQSGLNAEVSQQVDVDFKPFVVFSASETLYKLPASLAFPLVVAVSAWRSRVSDVGLRFMWTLTAVALFVTLCIVEGGHRMMHGNFAWTGQTGVFLVYVESLLFLLTQPLQRGWVRAAWIVFAVHVACGLYWFSLTFEDNWTNVV
jgi:hypothetical protein